MVRDEVSGGRASGKVERVYWREEQLWVRIRSRDGHCLSVPWHQTDLPGLTAITVPAVPRLSPQSLMALAQYLQHHGWPSHRPRQKVSTR